MVKPQTPQYVCAHEKNLRSCKLKVYGWWWCIIKSAHCYFELGIEEEKSEK